MIYLLRHAETEWNFQLRKQGLDDSPLTPRGIEQAKTYGKYLVNLLDAEAIENGELVIYASPLGRTRITARYLVDALDFADTDIQIEPRLIEFDYGKWSGLTDREIEQQFPGALQQRELDKWQYTVPGGESYLDVERKVRNWMADLSPSKTTIVVTHSVVSRVIRSLYLDLPKIEGAQLDHPQNMIFRLDQGQIDTICVM